MAPYTGPDGVPGALDYMSFSTALYGESDLWTLCRQSSWLGTTSLPALITATSSNCPSTTLLSYYAHFLYVSGLIFLSLSSVSSSSSTSFSSASPPKPLQPPPCSLTLCLRCICFPRNAAALQVYKEGERKKKKCLFLFLFSCCHCFFFIKWIKLTYFIILNKKRYFSSPDWK